MNEYERSRPFVDDLEDFLQPGDGVDEGDVWERLDGYLTSELAHRTKKLHTWFWTPC